MSPLASANLPYPLACLGQLCRAHPTARKVVFAPSAQGGRAVQRALAAAGVPSLNLEVTTVRAHAAEWLPHSVLAEGRRALPIFSEGFLLDRLLGEEAAGATPSLLALRETVDALRMAGLGASGLGTDQAVDAADAARLDRLERLVAGYAESLARGGTLDGADEVRLAAERAEREPPPAGTIYAAFDETELSSLEARFVDALTDGGRMLHRIGFPLPGLRPPPASAEARYWPSVSTADLVPTSAGPAAYLGADDPPGEARTAAATGYRFLWGIGAQAEVRAVVRDVLERRLRLDQVEVAYAANDPYLPLLHAEVGLREHAATDDARERLPATFAAGFPLRLTRTGQALRGVLDWVEGGRDAAALVRLLQGGLVTFRSYPDAAPHRAAQALIEGGLGTGPGAPRRALDRVLAGLARRREEAAGKARVDEERVEELDLRIAQAEADRTALDDFVDCFPAEPLTPAAFCRGLRRALLRFGPVAPDGVEAKRGRGEPFSHDEFAFDLTQRRLHDFAEQAPAVLDVSIAPARAARALRDALLGGFLNARAPRAGSLHVVPLSSAGLSGRPHLYVVGLDGATASPSVVEDALLPDRDRERLDGDGSALPRAADAPRYQLWGFARALARVPAGGTVTLCARTHALASGDPLFPSSLLLRAAGLAGHDLEDIIEPATAVGLVPDCVPHAPSGDGATQEGRLALHAVEADLAARRCPRLGRHVGLARRFPAALQGLRAARARAAADLTLHDGWLGGPQDGLDFLGGAERVSPSRLETLATCPQRYFLRHVLGVEAPPEPPDPDTFLDPLERGTLLHEVFEAFGNVLVERGGPAHEDDEAALREIAEAKITELIEKRGEPAAAVLHALRRDVHGTARVFLKNELDAGEGVVPHACEQAFGFDRPVEVRLGPFALRLRGVVDRVDRLPDGTYEVSDFKTGSTYGFPEPDHADPMAALMDGTKLQWALYAYALEDAFGWRVTRSGYRFPGERAWGERRRYRVPDRAAVAEVVAGLAQLARAGFFPPAAEKPCAFCDYKRVCGDTARRRREMQAAVAAARADGDHPLAATLDAWPYK